MAKIIAQHPDGSNCYTVGCRQQHAANFSAESLAADFATHGPARKPRSVTEPLPTYKNEDEQEWWEMIRKNHRTIAVHGREFTLAPKNVSGVYCFECNTYLPEGSLSGASADAVTCPGCGGTCKSGLTGISIRHDNQRYLNKEAIKTTRWYHTSSHPDWETGNGNPLVHLGSETAAKDRVHDIDHQDQPVYLYEIELNPDAAIDDRLYEEDQFDPTQGNYAADHEKTGVSRYLNYYENPGSISLYANRSAFRIVSKTAV